ncbi:hypothetical protein GC170_10125 [bacterium]|nr:hypothetical protein [bacterium]
MPTRNSKHSRPDNRFAEVLREELDSIVQRREAFRPEATGKGECEYDPGHESKDDDRDMRSQRKRALRMSLFGLAFSGGGIRSATINLGILQALGHLQLLRYVDYLSTVSGGGYIGGWLAAWIRRETDSADLANDPTLSDDDRAVEGLTNVEKQLDPDRLAEARARRFGVSKDHLEVFDQEPGPIRHLRVNSRYLAPQWGPFTLDTWTLLAIYIRNLFINLMILLPWFTMIVLLCRLVVCWSDTDFAGMTSGRQPEFVTNANGPISPAIPLTQWVYLVLFVLLVFLPFDSISKELDQLRRRKANVVDKEKVAWLRRIQIGIPLSFLMAGVIGMVVLRDFSSELLKVLVSLVPVSWGRIRLSQTTVTILSPILTGISFVLIMGMQYAIRARMIQFRVKIFILDLLLAFVFGLILQVIVIRMQLGPDAYSTNVSNTERIAQGVALRTTFGPPLFLLALMIPNYLVVALAGHTLSEYEREWRSRMASLMLLWSVVWVVVFTMVILMPKVFLNFDHVLRFMFNVPARLGTVDQTAGQIIFFSGWTATILIGFSLLRPRTKNRFDALIQFMALVMYVLFQAGLITIVSVIVDRISMRIKGQPYDADHFFGHVLQTDPAFALLVAAGSGILAAWLYKNIPMNLFSLHSLYGNRLTRCYLAASLNREIRSESGASARDPHAAAPTGITQSRHGNPFTDLDPEDDMPLARLRVQDRIKIDTGEFEQEIPPYYGPYPIFNTTLNLISGGENDRKAESFVLTPAWCGSDSTGFARLSRDKQKILENLTIGKAITISGAAVDANMSILQSPQLTAFLTLINARLGAWISNPAKAHPAEEWDASGPQGAGSFFRELFGMTDAREDHVHLSDGGHFENSGVYELIRRRCRYVVMVDAAEDPEDASENLANLIRLVRRDFGIRIEIDTSPLHKDVKGYSLWHTAVGTIRYDEVDTEGVIGTLVFVRSSLTGDEPADILNYARKNSEFPHHPTTNQFFDENQFESYRGLGFHIGLQVFTEAAQVLHDTTVERSHVERLRRFFADVRRNWAPLAANSVDGYRESCSNYMKIAGAMRDLPAMRRVSSQIYPEIAAIASQTTDDLIIREKLAQAADPAALAQAIETHRDGILSELHGVDFMLQFLELAWIENQFDRYFAHPINRGWMTVMRRWTDSEPFLRAWPILRNQYSRGFVQFCERILNLGEPPAQWCRVTHPDHQPFKAILNEFDREFQREWSHLTKTEGQQKAHHALLDLGEYLKKAVRCSGRGNIVAPGQSAPSRDLRDRLTPHDFDAGQDDRYLAWILTWGQPHEKAGEISLTECEQPWSFLTSGGRMDSGMPFLTGSDAIEASHEGSTVKKYPIGLVVAFPSSESGPNVGAVDRNHLYLPADDDSAETDRFLELVVWIRGPYRSMGLGRECLPQILSSSLRRSDVCDQFGILDEQIFTRYPRMSLYSGERVQQSQWMSFFFDQGFVVHFDDRKDWRKEYEHWSNREVRLVRKLH